MLEHSKGCRSSNSVTLSDTIGGFVSVLGSVLKHLLLPGNLGRFVSCFGQFVVQNQVYSPEFLNYDHLYLLFDLVLSQMC